MTERKNWFQYFMDIAKQTATRATCNRKHVGAVIVTKHRSIIATGYNGSIVGAPHCDDVGHLIEDNHCVRTVHAETNALCQAARNGVSVEGAIMYCTALPCWPCFKQLCNSGISQIIYDEPYRADEHLHRLHEHADYADIRVYRLNESGNLVTERPEGPWKGLGAVLAERNEGV